jgi:hypothetical protein
MHCAAHRAELGASPIGKHLVVSQCISLLKAAYTFFKASSVRRDLLTQCQTAVGLESCAGQMPQSDVETRWASHTKPAERLVKLMPALLRYVHLHTDYSPESSISLHAMVTDLTRMLALAALQPMLRSVQLLSKTLQQDDIYVEVRDHTVIVIFHSLVTKHPVKQQNPFDGE